MSFKAFLRRCLMEYFIITTCVTAAIAILGLYLDAEAQFGYEAFFSPLIFGLVSLVPSLITYSKKELTFREALMRQVLYVIVLEALLVSFGFWAGILYGAADATIFVVSVLLVYLIVSLISWQIQKKDASEINKMLKTLQGRDTDS